HRPAKAEGSCPICLGWRIEALVEDDPLRYRPKAGQACGASYQASVPGIGSSADRFRPLVLRAGVSRDLVRIVGGPAWISQRERRSPVASITQAQCLKRTVEDLSASSVTTSCQRRRRTAMTVHYTAVC